ncbi:MAG: nascent polypeptide-associated complex protein [Thermoplasmata archaeon]|nr:nascent polypeptide-associated complex protein [Thermoplasmata archaeon]
MPGRMRPREAQKMMKKMGISTEEIEGVEEVIIKTKTKDYVFRKAEVAIMTIQGQKIYQLIGEPEIVEKVSKPKYTQEDVLLVVQQTNVSEEEARKALEETDGQPAEAILKIMSEKEI